MNEFTRNLLISKFRLSTQAIYDKIEPGIEKHSQDLKKLIAYVEPSFLPAFKEGVGFSVAMTEMMTGEDVTIKVKDLTFDKLLLIANMAIDYKFAKDIRDTKLQKRKAIAILNGGEYIPGDADEAINQEFINAVKSSVRSAINEAGNQGTYGVFENA